MDEKYTFTIVLQSLDYKWFTVQEKKMNWNNTFYP